MALPKPPARSGSLSELAAALLESDAAYFEAAARIEALPGAALAWMEGLPSVAAAGVAQRITPGLGGLAPGPWLDLVEEAVRAVGRTATRLYLIAPHPALETVLRRRGYRARTETGFLGPALPHPPAGWPGRITLRPIESEDDWVVKHALHRLADSGPDDYPTLPDEWVAMERRKAEAGYMRAYLLYSGPELCGAVSLARRGSLCRMKNLFLHPAWRRRGIGTALIGALVESVAAEERVFGTFALERTPGEALYRRCGLRPVARQTEWLGRNQP